MRRDARRRVGRPVRLEAHRVGDGHARDVCSSCAWVLLGDAEREAYSPEGEGGGDAGSAVCDPSNNQYDPKAACLFVEIDIIPFTVNVEAKFYGKFTNKYYSIGSDSAAKRAGSTSSSRRTRTSTSTSRSTTTRCASSTR